MPTVNVMADSSSTHLQSDVTPEISYVDAAFVSGTKVDGKAESANPEEVPPLVRASLELAFYAFPQQLPVAVRYVEAERKRIMRLVENVRRLEGVFVW